MTIPFVGIWRWRTLFTLVVAAFSVTVASQIHAAPLWEEIKESEVHGFLELRAGSRIQSDPLEKDASVLDARFQGEITTITDWAEFKFKGDIWQDGVLEKTCYDTREAWAFLRPSDSLDIVIGRQVLTWGTGDLVFLNDLFPKDWQSFFIGRDDEYLKAPSNSIKTSLFMDSFSLDFVFTPVFAEDRFITGEYTSFWNNSLQHRTGSDKQLDYDKPVAKLSNAEYATRIYTTFGPYETALYGYVGFWKSPCGTAPSGEHIFPRLNVCGASLRGPLGKGIGNIETAYYHSVDDPEGKNGQINNSELRHLIGYTQEIARDFTGSVQYYVEHLLHHDRYKSSTESGTIRDEFRHVLTFQLIKLLMNQNLEVSLSGYWSPSDQDTYLRPKVQYKINDNLTQTIGANLFMGRSGQTMFGQHEDNSNIYAALRYSF